MSCYTLVYKTPDATGTLIDASGLLCLPKGKSGASPLLSFQHGTIFKKTDAPSSGTSSYYWTGPLFASMGYIAVAPDFLGYGASGSILHAICMRKRFLRQSWICSALPDTFWPFPK